MQFLLTLSASSVNQPSRKSLVLYVILEGALLKGSIHYNHCGLASPSKASMKVLGYEISKLGIKSSDIALLN